VTTLSPRTRIWTLFLAVAVLLSTALVACGGDDDSSSTTTPTTTASVAASASSTDATTATASATAAGTAAAGGPSTSFSLGGLVSSPAEIVLADLQTLPQASVTTNPMAGGTPMGEHAYSGPLLYDLIQKAGLKADPDRKNDALRKSIVVTGTDGYSVAFAWGEIDPRFAGKQILMAFQRDGQPLPEDDGFARTIVPGDGAAGRYVSNVAKVEVKDVGTLPPAGERGASTSFELSGLVNSPGEFDLAKLQAMKQTDVTVSGKDANGNAVDVVYSGVLLNDFLQSAGLKLDADRKNDMLRVGVLAIGSDGYSSLVVGGEIDPKFGNVQVLIATAKDGQPLSDDDGFARIVVPGDAAAGRYVSNLVKLEVVRLD
jgi:DMSO/TMAO reductase YedYZ molybdopterin-dependent catalytic subunit